MDRRAFPLEHRTSLRVGGPADRFAEPETEEELLAALARAADDDLFVRVLGGGQNLLVDDRGVEGLVLSLRRLRGIEVRGNLIVARAGVTTARLLATAVAHSLSGLECLAGVPGTVGGAVRMNAGGVHGTIGDRVEWVRGFTLRGERFMLSRRGCGFRYRGSSLEGAIVSEAGIRLTPTKEDLRARTRWVFVRKHQSQPLGAATAGCMFRNPTLPGGESAGWLIERAGMKGVRQGGARVSPVHANFVENRGDATFADIRGLLFETMYRVADRFGVDLALEVCVWKREEEVMRVGAREVA
jgi:UDP-N-acetylmuramate dehydrogenase